MTTKTTKTTTDTKYLSKTQIIKSVGSIARRSATLQADIHRTAISALMLWNKSQEEGEFVAETMTALGQASPYHGKAFASWVQAMTNLIWAKDHWMCPAECTISNRQFRRARDLPFFEYSKPSEAKPYDLMDILRKTVDTATKKNTKATENDNIPMDILRQVRALVLAYESEHLDA